MLFGSALYLRGLPRVTLPKLFDWYSEDFGGKEKVLLWLLGVLPEEQREELRVLVEAEYDSPVLGLDYPTEELNDARKRHDSVDSNHSKVSTGSRSSAVRQSSLSAGPPTYPSYSRICLASIRVALHLIQTLSWVLIDVSLVDELYCELRSLQMGVQVLYLNCIHECTGQCVQNHLVTGQAIQSHGMGESSRCLVSSHLMIAIVMTEWMSDIFIPRVRTHRR